MGALWWLSAYIRSYIHWERLEEEDPCRKLVNYMVGGRCFPLFQKRRVHKSDDSTLGQTLSAYCLPITP